MSWIKGARARARSLLRPGESEARMDEEFRFHMEMETERLVAAGVQPDEARRRARMAFGGVERHREGMRDGRGLAWLRDAARDARHAVRALARAPGFAAVAILTIGLGTGATTTLFSVTNTLLLRPLPVADPQRLVTLQESRSGMTASGAEGEYIPYDRFLAYRDATHGVFSGLAAHRYLGLSVRAGGNAFPAGAMAVSASYFQVLGVRPGMGRFFASDAEPSVVLSHRFWRERFAGGARVVGSTLVLNGRPFTVAGVAPRGFDGTITGIATELWVPFEAYQAGRGDANPFEQWVAPFGRLAPGVEAARAAARVDALGRAIPPGEPQTRVRAVRLEPLTGLPGEARRPLAGFLGMLMATGALVLLIAGANIAAMLLARGVARRREVAVRLAVGAGRGRLVRQLVVETLVLFLAGGAAGVAVAFGAAALLRRFRLPTPERVLVDATPDPRVLAFALAVAAATGIAFGLAPALRATRPDLLPALKEGAGRGGPGHTRVRSAFVAAQLALAVLLMVVAGLFVRTLQRGLAVDPGFRPDGVVVASLNLAPHGYDAARGLALQRRLADRVRALPGVESAALAERAMLSVGSSGGDVHAVGGPRRGVNARYNVVDPAYLGTLGVRLVAGRGIAEGDQGGAPRVVVVNQTLAARLWPGENPLGRRLDMDGTTWEVVGVVRDGRYVTVNEEPRPYAFFPLAQRYSARVTLHVRSGRSPAELLERVGRELRALDADVALESGGPLSEVVGFSLLPQRAAAWLVGVLGALGLVLAAVGVYGVLAFQVAQRTHELGVRVALGATARDIVAMVVGRGALLVAAGTAAGLLLAAATTRFLAAFLFGVSPLDPATFAAVAATLAVVALAASLLPALRAVRVDPARALRAE